MTMNYDSDRSRRLLELNRFLIEGRGDAFARALADHIQIERMPIGDAALVTLLAAAHSIQRDAGCAQGAFISKS